MMTTTMTMTLQRGAATTRAYYCKRLVGATLGYGEMKDKRQLKRMGWWTATAWCSGHMQQLVQTKVMFKADEAEENE
jgi:hypothetical protein